MTTKPQAKPLVVWPIALMGAPAFVAIWSGWSEIAVRAGLGWVATVVPVSVVTLTATAGLAWFRTRSRPRLLVWAVAVVASGTAYGAVLQTSQTSRLPGVLAALVWAAPLALLTLAAHLAWTTRKETRTDA